MASIVTIINASGGEGTHRPLFKRLHPGQGVPEQSVTLARDSQEGGAERVEVPRQEPDIAGLRVLGVGVAEIIELVPQTRFATTTRQVDRPTDVDGIQDLLIALHHCASCHGGAC